MEEENKIKPFGYRPSVKALAILEAYMKEKGIKSKSQAVNEILEQYNQPTQPTNIKKCPLKEWSLTLCPLPNLKALEGDKF